MTLNLKGTKAGRLLVLRKVGSDIQKRILWECQCDCGNIVIIKSSSLKTTKSCGCLRKEVASLRMSRHGESKTKLYSVWGAMQQRCVDIPLYSDRGISVCDEWLDFQSFKKWALANGYQEGLYIDRIENDGDYEPNNCRFVTSKESANNRRTCTYITALGETKTMKEWSDDSRCKVNYETLVSRLVKYNWSPEIAIMMRPKW